MDFISADDQIYLVYRSILQVQQTLGFHPLLVQDWRLPRSLLGSRETPELNYMARSSLLFRYK